MSDTSPTLNTEALREGDHDAGLHKPVATVTRIDRPSSHLVRLLLSLPDSASDPAWGLPNVALRFNFGPELDNASRVYTVRDHLAEQNAITVDVVLHEGVGPMMTWIKGLGTGDTVSVMGPRPHFRFPQADGHKVAVFADDTAIPALYSILRQAPADLAGSAWVASSDTVAVAELSAPQGFTIHQLDPAQPDQAQPDAGGALARQAQTLSDPAQFVVWGAGERDEMRLVRRHFRNTVGLAKEHVCVFGYWKRGVTNTEIDAKRLAAYQAALAKDASVTELDDWDIDI